MSRPCERALPFREKLAHSPAATSAAPLQLEEEEAEGRREEEEAEGKREAEEREERV